MKKSKIFLIIIFSLSINSNIFAQTSIDNLIGKALENNALLKSKEWEIMAAKSLIKTSSELPKTNLNLQFGRNEGFEYNDAVVLSQSIPSPSVFKAKKNHFEAQSLSKEIQKEISINDLKTQIRSFYYQIVYLNQNEKTLKSLDSLYLDFVKIASLRYNTGESKQADIYAAENQRGEISLLLQQNSLEKENALNALSFLVGQKIDLQFEDFKALNLTSAGAASLHPLYKFLEQESEVLNAQKEVERTLALPDFSLGYTNASLIGPHVKNGIERNYGRGQRFGYFDFGITIPINYKATKAKISALENQKQALVSQAEYQQNQLQTELENAYKQHLLNTQKYQYYTEKGLPNSEAVLKASHLGYSTGETSYLDYLMALRTTSEVRLKHLETLKNLNQTVINIWYILNY